MERWLTKHVRRCRRIRSCFHAWHQGRRAYDMNTSLKRKAYSAQVEKWKVTLEMFSMCKNGIYCRPLEIQSNISPATTRQACQPPIEKSNLLSDKLVQNSTPCRPSRFPLPLLLEGFVVDLPTTRVDVDIGDFDPLLTLPNESNEIEQDDHEESQIRLEESHS